MSEAEEDVNRAIDIDGFDESDPLNVGYQDGWNDAIDQVVKMLYSTAAEVRKLRHKKEGEQL